MEALGGREDIAQEFIKHQTFLKRLKVLAAVKMCMLIFWVGTLCRFSEKHNASNFGLKISIRIISHAEFITNRII
jgi:hypothetical protein